jgi:nucleoside-diphosphate-sugar epimerase
MKICVTGAAGQTGVATVHHLLEHGHEVIGADIAPYPAALPPRWSRPDFTYLHCDLTDFGDTVDTLRGLDAVVHLANIPAPRMRPPARTIQVNTTMNNNVFLAAADVGLRKVVWASSETTLGLDFAPDNQPSYAPLDEDHYPRPTTTYSLSKVLGETAAEHVSAWSGIPFVGLRLSNVISPAVYQSFPDDWADPRRRMFNLWSYIDVRDCALACRLALAADVAGASTYLIAAADTAMPIESTQLMREFFPDVPLTAPLGRFDTLQSIARAREVLGFEPEHSWRDEVPAP